MCACPVCKSEEIYVYKECFRYTGANNQELRPKVGGKLFLVARLRPSVRLGCGHIWLITSEEARAKSKAPKHRGRHAEVERDVAK